LGQAYDVLGKPGSVYNLISTHDFIYNARFENAVKNHHHAGLATVIGAIGFVSGDDKITVTINGAGDTSTMSVHLNDELITPQAKTLEFGTGAATLLNNDTLSVTVNHFKFKVERVVRHDCVHLDDGVTLTTNPNYMAGSTHGLLGQTVDMTGKRYHVQMYYGAGVPAFPDYLDGQVSDYMVEDNDLLGANFKYTMHK
jgi:hypothetical protein